MRSCPALPALVAVLALLASPVAADCYADYKAKRDNPLRLHYGTIKLDDTPCTKDAAKKQIRKRIKVDNWKLLTVLDVFDRSGLAERKESAGKFHLRY